MIPVSARAQFGAVASLYSDDRYRGVSVSDGRPVGVLDVSYDARNGMYAGLSGRIVASRHEGLKPLSLSLNGGYARRLRSDLTADIGVVHARYSSYSGLVGTHDYTEVYAGLSGKLVGGRVSVSPNYLGIARWTAYAEVNGHRELSRRTLLDAQVGVLTTMGGRYSSSYRPQLDARLGLSQRFGPVTLHGAITTRTKTYSYRGSSQRGTALVIGISSRL